MCESRFCRGSFQRADMCCAVCASGCSVPSLRSYTEEGMKPRLHDVSPNLYQPPRILAQRFWRFAVTAFCIAMRGRLRCGWSMSGGGTTTSITSGCSAGGHEKCSFSEASVSPSSACSMPAVVPVGIQGRSLGFPTRVVTGVAAAPIRHRFRGSLPSMIIISAGRP